MYKITLSVFLLLFTVAAQASSKCDTQLNYDIIVTPQAVSFIDKNETFTVSNRGELTLNGVATDSNKATIASAATFQRRVREKLPDIEKQTYLNLENVRKNFDRAIREKLGVDSSLLAHLTSIHSQLNMLLKKAINTENNITTFRYQAFNRITDEGEKIAKKEFVGILANSIKEFTLFKNFSALKKVAKEEWRPRKEELKKFNEQVCETLMAIDNDKNALIKQSQAKIWLD